jgi:hypothetical protein
MLNALDKGLRNFIAAVGCSGGGGLEGTMLWWMTVKRVVRSQTVKCLSRIHPLNRVNM